MWKISKVIVICCILLSFYQQTIYAKPSKTNKYITLIVKSSPDSVFHSKLLIYSANIHKTILDHGIHRKTNHDPITDTYLIINQNGQSKTYMIDSFANLLDQQLNETIHLPQNIKEKLMIYIGHLRAIHYGKIMDWNKAKHVIARKSVFSIIDLETGLQFQVQRRAGKNHADVQPLTKYDTAVMKQIYQGKWSWKRRAILVHKDDQFLAASMHGMPHGGDGIPGNGFRGHFCIHFPGSSTHGSGSVDFGHQLMVYKAAGKLKQYVQDAAPYHIVDAFFIAVNQQDSELMKMVFTNSNHLQLERIKRHMKNIKAIHNNANYEAGESSNLLAIGISITASIYRSGKKEEKKSFIFQLRRYSFTDPWKIDFIENDPFNWEE